MAVIVGCDSWRWCRTWIVGRRLWLTQEAFSLSASYALKARNDTPVGKVLTLLEDLKTEAENEGKAEAATYDTCIFSRRRRSRSPYR